MAFVPPETFSVLGASAAAILSRPAFHHLEIVVDAVVLEQPLPLAHVLCQHGGLVVHLRGLVHKEVRQYVTSIAVAAADRVHKIQMWNCACGTRGLCGPGRKV